MQNILCGNRRPRVHNSHTTQTDIHASMKAPVDWRQLKVTVQAACKQSKEQNGFRVVRGKTGAESFKRGRETDTKTIVKLHSWLRVGVVCDLETRTKLNILKC